MSETVSVVMPTKGRTDLVQRAVKSVLAQTHDAIEVLVLDDSQGEDAQEIMNIAESDSRIKYVARKGIGVSEARELGIHLARGKFLALLDSDDYWTNNRLERHVDVWKKNEIGLSWDRFEEVGGPPMNVYQPFEHGLIKAPAVARRLYLANFIHASAGFTTTDLARKVKISWSILSDWLLYMRLAESLNSFFIDETLSFRSMEPRGRVSDFYKETFFFKESLRVRRRVLSVNPVVYIPVWVERSISRLRRKLGI